MKLHITRTVICLLSTNWALLFFCYGESQLVANLDSGLEQVVVAYGTSLTANGGWVEQLGEVLEERYPGQAEIVNSGQPGKSSIWGLANLEERVINKNPDTVFIEFAINDAFYTYDSPPIVARKNLEQMIGRIVGVAPDCEIILMVMNPPINEHLDRRPNLKTYYQMYRDVGSKLDLLLIDHYESWERILVEAPELFDRYVPDGIHPNAEGTAAVTVPNVLAGLGISMP